MLQAIRDKAQGWIAWAIVILITIPFALWGIQEYIGTAGDQAVAEVDGKDITEQSLAEQARRTREELRSSLGAKYRAGDYTEQMLRAQALDGMINEQVLYGTMADWHMRASNQMVVDAIQHQRAFQKDNAFDHELYRTVLRNNAMSETEYEGSVRQQLTRRQLETGVAGSAFATRSQLDRFQQLSGQKRTLAYAVITADSLLAGVHPDDQAIETYFQAHQADYGLPDRVRLDYLLLDVDTLAKQVPADPGQVKAWYSQHKGQFTAPEERRVRHILIPVAGDEAAAKAKAESLHEQLVNGADFAELAKQQSADPVSAAKGGDLGWVSRGMMVGPFEQSAFALAKGALSEPVKSKFGYHLIQVEDIRGGGEADFATIADKVTAAYRRAQAERLYYERAERLAELAYETPDNLVQVAQTLGLTVQHSDWLDQQGGAGDLASPKVVAAAFSDDVLNQGLNSELLELGPEKVLVLRVADHQPARARSLDEVRDQVVQAVRRSQASAAARAAGETALKTLQDGAALADLARDKGWQFHAAAPVGRDQADVPAAVRDHAFAMPRPAEDKPQLGGTPLASGGYALLALSAVEQGKVADDKDTLRKLMAGRLATLRGQMDYTTLLKDRRARADVKVMLEPSGADKP